MVFKIRMVKHINPIISLTISIHSPQIILDLIFPNGKLGSAKFQCKMEDLFIHNSKEYLKQIQHTTQIKKEKAVAILNKMVDVNIDKFQFAKIVIRALLNVPLIFSFKITYMSQKNYQNYMDSNILQIVNLVQSINCTLCSIGLMDDFRVIRSFRIFISILRKVNTDLSKIIYSQEEELLYQQKLNYIQKKNQRVQNQYNQKISQKFRFIEFVPNIQEVQFVHSDNHKRKKKLKITIATAGKLDEKEQQQTFKQEIQKKKITQQRQEINKDIIPDNKDQIINPPQKQMQIDEEMLIKKEHQVKEIVREKAMGPFHSILEIRLIVDTITEQYK